MHTKAPPPIRFFESRTLSAVLAAYFELNQLKHLYRQGWLRVGIPKERCESVAEHILGVALLGLFVTETYFPDRDAMKVVRLALLHDLGEARVGDFTPHHAVTREEKHAAERGALREMLGRLPRGEEYVALWEDYEQGASFEARLVRQLDRLEMGLQACVYEHATGQSLEEFFVSVRKVVETPELQALLAELEGVRPGR